MFPSSSYAEILACGRQASGILIGCSQDDNWSLNRDEIDKNGRPPPFACSE